MFLRISGYPRNGALEENTDDCLTMSFISEWKSLKANKFCLNIHYQRKVIPTVSILKPGNKPVALRKKTKTANISPCFNWYLWEIEIAFVTVGGRTKFPNPKIPKPKIPKPKIPKPKIPKPKIPKPKIPKPKIPKSKIP